MQIDSANPFQTFILTDDEDRMARTVNPYTLAYIKNKVAIYALATVNHTYDDVRGAVDSDRVILLNSEKLKAQVEVLQELLAELRPQEEPEDGNTNEDSRPPTPLSL